MGVNNINTIISDDFTRTPGNDKATYAVRNHIPNIDNATKTETEKELPSTIVSDKYTKQSVVDALDKLNNTIELFNKRLKFSYNEEAGRVVVKIINANTDQVIREIPPKEVLNFVTKFHELIGVFIDKKQ